ncbi:alkaline phosphatase family protein [Microvirga sp. VF16]|uniref:alkaline phosphatase family protein n=1 Tax=Microvirga sp. VF16 TaxID=2807101 RepID=UPI00193DF83E|nr:alkaline phosphatase family protein [Microvirga sp. VF16]QRM32402.1 alkaline phosphatase family protein [Microvirga sp. VF16]
MPRFLLVSFDGLRPDLIDRKLTPNICRLQNAGVTLAQHRTIYPSETRSAFPSLVTGTTASRHGMVGNKYVDRATTPPRYIDTSNAIRFGTGTARDRATFERGLDAITQAYNC